MKEFLMQIWNTLLAAMKPGILELPTGEKVSLVAVPNTVTIHDFDRFRDHPRRLEEKIAFVSIQAFISYLQKWKNVNTIISGTLGGTLHARIDYHGAGTGGDVKPSWCCHHATFVPELSLAWKIWTGKDGKRMGQREFVEFIEDNAADIAAPDVGALVSALSNITVTAGGSARGRVSGAETETGSDYKISALVAGFEKLTLNLSPWERSAKYELKARVFASADEGSIVLRYQLISPQRVILDLIEKNNATVSLATGIPVYL